MAVKLLDMYVDINADGKKAAREASDDFKSVGEPGFARNGFNFGKRMVGGLALAVGGAAIAGVGTLAGVALTKGLDRALSIQDATAKLTGLGHSGESVRQIMDNALASVKGTAFGLGDAASVAAGAVAAGIAPGEKLTRVLKLTADAATIAGMGMGEMGSIFNKVAASGKLQGDVIAQLQDAGVPVLQFVAKQMGVTAEEAANLASQGKVSFETFSDAMEAGLGGAALSSGATARGAFANVMAALGRFGAMFTTPVVAAAPAFFSTLSGAIDQAAAKAQPFADKFSAWVGPAIEDAGNKIAAFVNGEPGKLKDFFDGISDAADRFLPYLPGLASGVADFGKQLGSVLGPAIEDNLPGIKDLAKEFVDTATDVLPQLIPALGDLVLAILPLIPAITPLVTELLPPLVDLLGKLLEPTGSTEGLDGVTGALEKLVGALVWFLGVVDTSLGGWNAIFDLIDGSAEPVETFKRAIGGDFGPIVQFFVTGMATVWSALGQFARDATEWARTLPSNVVAWLQGLPGAVQSIFSAAISWLFQAGINVVMGLYNGITSTQPLVLNFVRSIPGRIIGLLAGAAGWLVGAGQSATSGLANGAQSGFGAVVSFVSSIPGRIVGAMGNVGGILVGAGAQVVNGFVSGMMGGIQRVANAAAQVAATAANAAKAALNIQSPSRVFRDEVGKMVGAGFIVGIEAMAPKMQVAMATAVTPGASVSRAVDRGYAAAPSLQAQTAAPSVTNYYTTVPVTAADNPTLYGNRTARAIVDGLI